MSGTLISKQHVKDEYYGQQDICPICESHTILIDVVDFNKSCAETSGVFLPICGKPIYYTQCQACGFTFAPEMCKWTDKDFSEQVYNEEYLKVDPDYVAKRPVNSFNLLQKLFPKNTHSTNHLDYGGGNGYLSKLLREQGWESNSFDPFLDNQMSIEKLGKYNLITAFEVFEHVPNTNLLLKNLSKLMHSDSLIIFSTLISDGHIKLNGRLDWWYASPRNGHISLYSKTSLTKLASKFELKFGSFNENVHCFVKQVPSWASHLF